MDSRPILLIASAAVLATGTALGQDATAEDDNAVTFRLDARVRTEAVEEANTLRDATSTTLRVRAGAETPTWNGLDAIFELEAVEHLGPEDFNSGGNGRTQFSAVLDPTDSEVNQLAVRYRQGHHYLQIGRQHMILDNARFFGDVVYRQNQQTFDALSYMNTALPGKQFRYIYMTRARRFLSDENPIGEIDMNSHLLNYRWQRLNGDVFTAYAYLVDMDTPAVVANSSQTFGMRYTGSVSASNLEFLYTIEYADQSDYADGATFVDADYLLGELGVALPNEWFFGFGQERLGGDGNYGFQTPFGTNHLFNGYADLFAARTPPDGLVDSYARLRAPIAGARMEVSAHDFASDAGSENYGTELNLRIERRFAEHFAVSLLFADYQADGFGVDTQKVAIWFDARL